MQYNNPTDLCGVWSHGVSHGYYGYSHDIRLVLLPDGRGSYCHDGWWRYRLYEFFWHVTPIRQIQFLNVIATEDMKNVAGYKLPSIIEEYRISFDSEQQLDKLEIDELEYGFYLVCDCPEVAVQYLSPGPTGNCGNPSVERPPRAGDAR